MEKIQMTTPLVEMDGDEMTRILWKMIKDELIYPFIDLKSEYYDLGLEYRNETNDQVTFDSAYATQKYGVAVKCATITPNAARMTEYDLKEMWKSPNGTIRAILDGTVFRTPIIVKGIEPCVKNWKAPITIARHAYGDVYKNVEIKVPGAGKAELVFTGADGTVIKETIHEFDGPGVIQGQHNINKSIESFARCCFNYALDIKQTIWFATKDTISKKYDHTFKDIFQEIFDKEYKEKFDAAGIEYFYTLIDDAVARVMKSEGGFIWACKNYDGDVMSDMISSAFGSLAMMTSVLVSPDGKYLLYTLSGYGNFSIWHKDADLYMIDLSTLQSYPLEAANSDDVESYHSWSSNSRWFVFSSRRIDGLYTRPYIAYVDEDGKVGKPFLLPQKDAGFYQSFMKSFNIPEFITGKVKVRGRVLAIKAKEDKGTDVRLAQQ